MSEYQRYEFMTCDRPLTPEERAAVGKLSSHIAVSPAQAVVDYEWGDFKHDPIKVLHDYFDGFLYWANWGSPQLAFRFPHDQAPTELFESYINQYELDDLVTVTRYPDYDILDIHFGKLEGPSEWVEHDLDSMLPLREELLEGDLRALYITWLAAQHLYISDTQNGADEPANMSDADATPPVAPNLNKLTPAHRALARLLELPSELLIAASRHSAAVTDPAAPATEDIAEQLQRLPPERATDYLLRLARNEPGLSRQLTKELHELSLSSHATISLSDLRAQRRQQAEQGERMTFSALQAESVVIRVQHERERQAWVREQREQRRRQYQDVHDNAEDYWRQAETAAASDSGIGYIEAADLLIELRDAAQAFGETPAFNQRFLAWLAPHRQRDPLMQRLREQRFPIPEQ